MFKGEAEGRGKNQSSPIRWGGGGEIKKIELK